MANLNKLKMIGLVVLLAIALALPTVMPKTGETGVMRGGVQSESGELQQAVTV